MSMAGVALDPLPGLIGYALRRAHGAVFHQFRRHFADLDIRPVQLGILTVVGNNPDLKQSEVSAALGIKRANLVPLLDDLARRGVLRREKVATDRRSHALRLTEAGDALLRACRAREAAFEQGLAAGLGPGGRRQLLSLLAEIQAVCQEGSAPGDPDEDLSREPSRASPARRQESGRP